MSLKIKFDPAEKIKVSAVSYTNTKPFIYGLRQTKLIDQIDLSLDIPADCAQKLIEGKVDVGLIPVAAIPDVPGARIISDYCIGSVGAVNSVFIFSHVPVEQIKKVKLDNQSRTSNNLAKVLLKFHWKTEVMFTLNDDDCDAMVLIGDRTFGRKADFAYAYDMGEVWMEFTGLPFVYAAWVANRDVPADFITQFNLALAFGLANRDKVLAEMPESNEIDLEDYLFRKLDFDLTEEKQRAMNLFLSYIEKL